ncbi:MAG: hypothetical protein LBR71_04045 [Synergistaceae bacterium]|nr:hypothetical protein [Synergistaceae bacterium]
MKEFDDTAAACFERALQYLEWDPEEGHLIKNGTFEKVYAKTAQFLNRKITIVYMHDTTKIKILGVRVIAGGLGGCAPQ